jgi:glycosyltransferase involved in cell wall biosynthesis
VRIGIDATPLPPQPVGAGNYIINLIRALASLDREDELVVFAQRSGSALLDLQGKPGVETVVLPDRSPAARLIWEQIAFPRLVSQKKVDLLHSLHYTRPFNLPSASVVTLHDMTFFLFPELHTRPKRIYFPMMIRLSARKSDELIADSESTRQDALSILNLPGDKIVTVPLGVSEAYRPITDKSVLAAIQQKYTLPEGFILYVGLVEPRKNIPILVRAYRQIVDRGFNQKLVIVGRKGWSYQEVLNQIDSFGLKDRIHFTGYIPQDDLPIVYNLASLFVYPSVYAGDYDPDILHARARRRRRYPRAATR